MECKTVRLVLEFARPGELAPADAASLEGHLAGCPECEAWAAAGRQFDARVGPAMPAVPPPGGLRGRLLARLTAERQAWRRARVGSYLRRGAAAAAVLVASVAGIYWFVSRPTTVEVAQVWSGAFGHPERFDVEAGFHRLGVRFTGTDFDFTHLTAYGMAELPGYPGQVVPRLTFRRDTPARPDHATVYVLDKRRFSVPAMEGGDEQFSGAPYNIRRWSSPGERCVYLIFYDGADWPWILDPRKTPRVGPPE
jgi:hypothetical protein